MTASSAKGKNRIAATNYVLVGTEHRSTHGPYLQLNVEHSRTLHARSARTLHPAASTAHGAYDTQSCPTRRRAVAICAHLLRPKGQRRHDCHRIDDSFGAGRGVSTNAWYSLG